MSDKANSGTGSRNYDRLLPCPFCGGEASVQTTYAVGVSEAFCLDCGAHTGYQPDGCTEAEAIAAWNIRAEAWNTHAEQTCEMVYGEDDHGIDSWWCQSCGTRQAATFRYTDHDNIIEPRYCQGCGRKVVD